MSCRETILRNFTPHEITIYDASGKKILLTIPVEKSEATVFEAVEHVAELNGIPVVKKTYEHIEGLPVPEKGIVNIVSLVVLQALKGKRSDVVSPDTGKDSVVRDAEGNILGVRRFQT